MMLLDALDAVPSSAPAIVDDSEESTYGELRTAAHQYASSIEERAGRGQYVLVKARSTVRFVRALLGILYSGNTPVPVAPELSLPDLDYMMRKSRAAALVDPAEDDLPATGKVTDQRDPSRPAMVLFTSGTTGYPKGVIVSHENLEHSCRTISGYLDYHRYRSAAVVLPLHYSYALLSQVCCQLFVGGRIRLFAHLRNPLAFAREVTDQGLETLCGVPSTFHALTTVHQLRPLHMPTVKVLCSAGAAMDRGLLPTIREIFPAATFFNNYGMTEATPRVSYVRDDDPRFGEPTCGRPIDGVEVKIIDPVTHQELSNGDVGVLVVRGPNVTNGYLNDPARTRRAFTGDGFLISNDLARIDQGYIFICGRNDDVFNVSGEKVSPLEIERALNHLPAVTASAVRGLKDRQRGMIPVAFLKLDQPVSRGQLVDELKTMLSPIKVPQRFLEVRDFPMTPNGKLKRSSLSPNDETYVVRELD